MVPAAAVGWLVWPSSQAYPCVLTPPTVLDVNDETPTFFPTVYNVSVSEDVPRDFRVVWLNCTDNDVGLNAELSYFITSAALSPPPSSCAGCLGWGRGAGERPTLAIRV